MNTNNLSPQQLQAIRSNHEDIAVIAGPGSGKTTVLVQRITRLLKSGVPPKDITVITFTNAAAREIEKRLAKMRDDNESAVELGYSGTVHGFILRLLKTHGRAINLPPTISMLGEEDANKLRGECREGQKVKPPVKDVEAALAKGPSYYLLERPASLSESELVAASYYRTLIESGLMDFDSLLQFGIMLLDKMRTDKTPLAVPFLFWDEVQDGGAEDWAIMRLIKATQRFVVGDPDQSIYGFRGAKPELFTRHLGTDVETIILEKNFRCRAEICAAANKLIAHNPNRVHKDTLSAHAENQIGHVIYAAGANDEAQEILYLSGTIKYGEPAKYCEPREIAVLVRFQALVERYSKLLASYGIPIKAAEKSKHPFDWENVRALIALFSNPENDILMHKWLVRVNDKKSADHMKLHAMRNAKPIVAMLGNQHLFPLAPALESLAGLLAQHGISQESIVRVQKAVATLPATATLAELSYALADEDLHMSEAGDGVTVTTYHAAKGREWDMVILPAFEQGSIPNQSKKSDITEERRLAFVGFTRARKMLVISNALTRPPLWGHGAPVAQTPSQFAAEAAL